MKDVRRGLKEFGNWLKEARLKSVGGQKEALKAIKRTEEDKGSQALLTQYETGRIDDPDPEVLRRLADAYKVDFVQMINRLVQAKYDVTLSLSDDNDRDDFFGFSNSQTFGRRLDTSRDAKTDIASYCATTDFWRSDDVTFVESGTLSAMMLSHMYQKTDPRNWPRELVTNMLVLPSINLRAREQDKRVGAEFEGDRKIDYRMIGGKVVDDMAAVMPDELYDDTKGNPLPPGPFTDWLSKTPITHIVMMATRFTREEGPCSQSTAVRRMKKLLLRHVARSTKGKVRLSVLFESEKLGDSSHSKRKGVSADEVPLHPDLGQNERYWHRILKSKVVTIISSLPSGKNDEHSHYVCGQVNELRGAGLNCVLLKDGKPIASDNE